MFNTHSERTIVPRTVIFFFNSQPTPTYPPSCLMPMIMPMLMVQIGHLVMGSKRYAISTATNEYKSHMSRMKSPMEDKTGLTDTMAATQMYLSLVLQQI